MSERIQHQEQNMCISQITTAGSFGGLANSELLNSANQQGFSQHSACTSACKL